MTYLDEAAAELRHARAANDERRERTEEVATYNPELSAKILEECRTVSMAIAALFADLAAIEAGLAPCCHRAQPEQEPQS